MDSIDTLWDRIELWLAANAPEIPSRLKPGLTAEEINEIEAGMEGLVLPEDIKASYRRHNGYGSGSFLMEQEIWYKLEDMFVGERWLEQCFSRDVLQRKPEYLTDLDPIQPVWRHPAWLNLTSNGAGDNWCIDLAPLPEGHVGQIISFSHEIGPECVIATSFQALLATFADELEEWSVHEKKPLIGQPWIMFTVSPQDPQEVPVADAFVRFEVHRLLKN